MKRGDLFECQNGPARRAWLRTLGWQVRPTLRRFCSRLWSALPDIILIVLAIFGFLCLLALAMTDPLTTTESLKKPVSAPVVQPLRRMT
ncbi:hypothetical protein [Herbaspirillum sp. RV1423]|uniref:hypothetical protein n=1 Tax=Herbaspirillum sp. RV1423 TaxID=1443993 RepID=UPI0005522EE4|nr:hypothetical protein [Herbaspirillum sp. RV1423]